MKTCITLYLLFAINIVSKAQLPETFITKVSYLEHTLVNYDLIETNSRVLTENQLEGENQPSFSDTVPCLNLSELARYHGFKKSIHLTQYIDQEGELLSDKRMLYEENVRDDWMESYSRIVLGKQFYEIYGTDDTLLYQYDKEQFEDSLYTSSQNLMSPEDAANFEHYLLDDSFYFRTMNDFISMESPPNTLTDSAGYLIAQFDSLTLLYDHELKIIVCTEYDWFRRLKKAETVTIFTPASEGSSFIPSTILLTEWFKSKNGCCLRKSTLTIREQFQRIVDSNYIHLVQYTYAANMQRIEAPSTEYEVSIIPGSDYFLIQNKKDNISSKLFIQLYDLTGKMIMSQSITRGTPVKFPDVRAGLYIIEIFDESGKQSKIRTLLRPETSNSF